MGISDKIAHLVIDGKEHFLHINVNNFASVMNASENITNVVNVVCEESFNEGKVITEMQLQEQHERQTIQEMRKNIETHSVAIQTLHQLAINIYNETSITDKDFQNNCMDLGRELKEKFFEPKTADGKPNTTLNLINYYNTNSPTGHTIWEDAGLTKRELDRIQGIGEFEGKTFGLYDTSIGGGGFKEAQMDVNIINKISRCDIEIDGKCIFEDFLIRDGNGDVFKGGGLGIFQNVALKNFACQVDGNLNKLERMQRIIDLDCFQRQHNFGNHSGAKTRFFSRITGLTMMNEEMNEYTSQITKPYRIVKGVNDAKNKVGEVGFKAIQKGLNKSRQQEINDIIKRIKDLERKIKYANGAERDKLKKLLAQEKGKLKNLKELFNKRLSAQSKVGKVGHYIFNPHKALGAGAKKVGSVVSKKVVNTKVAKGLINSGAGRMAKKMGERGNLVKKGLTRFKRTLYRPIGSFTNPIIRIMRKIMAMVVKVVAFPLIIVLVIFIAGMIGIVGDHSSEAIVVAPLANPYDFKNYQAYYDELDEGFLKGIESEVQGYAKGTNLKGEKIFYGINGLNNEDGMENDDYNNGMYYKYITKNSTHYDYLNHTDRPQTNYDEGRSSNIEDIICMMAIIMNQGQSDYPDIAKSVLTWLYNISHTYNYQESELYACDSACHNIHYECNDHFHDYTDTDLRYNPFHAVKKSGGDYEVKKASQYCVVCNQHLTGSHLNNSCAIAGNSDATEEDYYGCVSHSSCYHGDNGNCGRSCPSGYCSNYHPVWECHHSCDSENCTHDCSGSAIGCGGYWECDGHPHYSCDGHEHKCCLGHRDIQMNIRIKFYEELKGIINKYNFGDNDSVYNTFN